MKFNRAELLQSLGWPKEHPEAQGHLTYSHTAGDFSHTTEIGLQVSERDVIVSHSQAPVLAPQDKSYLVKVVLDRTTEPDVLLLNREKTSPEVASVEDAKALLDGLSSLATLWGKPGHFLMILDTSGAVDRRPAEIGNKNTP
jgi:hypothetical protein